MWFSTVKHKLIYHYGATTCCNISMCGVTDVSTTWAIYNILPRQLEHLQCSECIKALTIRELTGNTWWTHEA